MSKIFGYTKKGGKDWFSSDPYSDKEIEAIKDPEGGGEISLPTAIPSPFARIDLFKTAFRNIIKSPDLKAYAKGEIVVVGRNDEKLVSDCLDLAEMLFNYDSIRDKIKIIVWDKNTELAKLKRSSDKHRRFAETLELYLDQDKQSYNFDLLNRLYLIEYNHKIIGCTSPVTLFFATANDLSDAQITLTKNDITFDEKYTPLYERDIEFQKYFYLLFRSNTLFSERMKDLDEYLNKNLAKLRTTNPQLYNELNELNVEDYFLNYSELDTGTAGDIVEVLGVPLRTRKREDIVGALRSSDFIIQATKQLNAESLPPLVLQNNLNKPFRYANDVWDNNIKVPFIDDETLDRRRLPSVNIQYPYLTVSDFLEPYLIRLVYPINKEKFFDGNLTIDSGEDAKGYLLPLKKQFFDYFSSEDLKNSATGKPSIKMIQGVNGAVKVLLKIPISRQGEYIHFERIYYEVPEDQLIKPDEENNKGVILQHQFGVTLFPFIKTNNPAIAPFYRVQLIDRNVNEVFRHADFDLKFFSDNTGNPVRLEAKKTRSRKNTSSAPTAATSQYYVLQKEFDFIQVKHQSELNTSGILIPNWQDYQPGNEVFSFAIDFGTTNTHIEYKVGGASPKPFDITPEDVQIATLFHPTKTTEDFAATGAIAIRELIEHEFVPALLGNNSDYKFPHRSVLAESPLLNIQTETFPLADFNIPFIYERKPERDKIQPNLKWAKREPGNQKRVKAFLENIIMLLRNKVLFNNGNLAETRLVWFYPSSMKPVRKAELENAWNELFRKYFNPINKPIGITESIAPFYYFKGVNRLQGGEVVSIDIGGGTTDVVVFKAKKPLLLTSFKYAANTIFGDGFSEHGSASTNGLINKYFSYYENLLATNKLYDLSKVLSTIKEKNRAEDINAFFFSIENNPKIKDKDLYSYNSLLARDEDLKILFLYFYSAIIYHIAKLMKTRDIELPKHLVFSGTGSKILSIITPNLNILASFSMKIFEGVYNQKFDSEGLTIETEMHMPKEVTCKGGLMSRAEDLDIKPESIKAVLTCLEDRNIYSLSLNKLDEEAKKDITNFVADFNSFFLELNRQFRFNDYFSVSQRSLEVIRNELNKHLRSSLEDGLEFNQKLDEDTDGDKEIEETLFFYPIIGAIAYLTRQLSALTPVNN